MLELTILSDKQVMRCIIFVGIEENTICKTGLDLEAEITGETILKQR